MTLFGSDVFLETVAEVFGQGRRSHLAVFRVEGREFRLPVLGQREVLTHAPFFDYVPALEHPFAGKVRPLAWLPHAVLSTAPTILHTPDQKRQHLAPFVAWERFPDWVAFEAWVSQKLSTLWRDSHRRRRNLEHDLGPVQVLFDDPREDTFDACLRWKSQQYRATGVPDMFAAPENVELFRRLKDRRAVVVSSLSAGDRVIAATFGGLCEGWYGMWVSAYDPAHAAYSPGRLLLHETLKESQRRGHSQFDFLAGEEEYKFHYATHCRTIGPLGTPPLKVRLVNELIERTQHALEHHPDLYRLARTARHRLFP